MSLLKSTYVCITYVYVYMSLCVYVCLQNYKCYKRKHSRSSPSHSIGPLQNPVLLIQGTFPRRTKGEEREAQLLSKCPFACTSL